MKKAIGYARISDQDQSNWSISGQQDLIKEYCQTHGIELVATFTDEGESAKNFDRSDWKQLEIFVKKNHLHVDLLIVMAWTRFSRNTGEAIKMIEQLENKYHIRVISINEPLNMHPDSPYFHYLRTQIIHNGELELRIIRDRTRFGIHQAQRAGRYVSKAPAGYLNKSDASGRPIISIDPEKAPLIKEAYNRFLKGETIQNIRSTMKEKGLIIKGNSALQCILQHPVYMGYIRKIAYYDDPEALVKGIHEPIIDESTWWRVQAIFKNKKPLQRTKISDDFPLRGVLKCFCQRPYTGAFSKGRKKFVPYYKCNTHTAINLNANKIHQQFDELLNEMSLPQIHVNYIKEKVAENIKTELADRQSKFNQAYHQLAGLDKKISGLEEKYFEGKVDDTTYSKWKRIYSTDQAVLRNHITDLQEPMEQVWKRYDQNLGNLANLQWVYSIFTVEEKQSFVREVFNNQLYYQENIYRTPYLMEIFKPKALILKEKRLLIYEQPPIETGIFAESAPERS
jgi:site-specific DNA recombinase